MKNSRVTTSNSITDYVTVVIRSAGERTTELCRVLACRQVPDENVFVIHEAPFVRAVEKTFEIGLHKNLPWTLTLDADIFLRAKAVHDIISCVENLDKGVFEFHGMILDKLIITPKRGGPHLYRTEYLNEALELIPREKVTGRPESQTFKKMAVRGYGLVRNDIVYGLHDYEQYYRDIYRKAYQHSQKHRKYVPYLQKAWSRLAHKDMDFRAALLGLRDGLKHEGEFEFDVNFFRNSAGLAGLRELPPEKEELDLSLYKPETVSRLILNFHAPPEHKMYTRIKEDKPGCFRKLVSKGLSLFRAVGKEK